MDDLAAFDEAELGKREDAVPVERWLECEVETGQRLDRRQAAHSESRLYPAVLAKGQFFGKQGVDRLGGG